MVADSLAECRRLLRMYWLVVEAGKGVTLSEGEDERFDGMIWKVFVHAATAVHLADTPVPLPHDPTKTYVDVPSLCTVTRAALEGAVALQYVMLSPDSAELRRFRVLVWKLGGFLDRKDMVAMTEEGERVKAEDAEAAEQLQAELRADPTFLDLDEKRQRDALKGNWRGPLSWVKTAEEVGYDAGTFADIYRFLSSVAHSSGLSAYLAWMLKGVDAQREHARRAISLLRVPVARVTLAYLRRFPSARGPLDAEPAEAELVELCASLDDRSDTADRPS